MQTQDTSSNLTLVNLQRIVHSQSVTHRTFSKWPRVLLSINNTVSISKWLCRTRILKGTFSLRVAISPLILCPPPLSRANNNCKLCLITRILLWISKRSKRNCFHASWTRHMISSRHCSAHWSCQLKRRRISILRQISLKRDHARKLPAQRSR